MSNVPLTPLADYVVVQQEEAKTKTAGGLLLPDKSGEKPRIARVLAVGPLVKDVSVGDKVIYGGYTFNEVKVDGAEYLLIKLENIFAKISSEDKEMARENYKKREQARSNKLKLHVGK